MCCQTINDSGDDINTEKFTTETKSEINDPKTLPKNNEIVRKSTYTVMLFIKYFSTINTFLIITLFKTSKWNYRSISIFKGNPLSVQSHLELPLELYCIKICRLSVEREFILSFCLLFDFDKRSRMREKVV